VDMKYTSDGAQGSDWWIKSANLTFSEILIGSSIPEKWSRYDLIKNDIINDIIQPVNKYVLALYPKPELISIKENIVVLRQKTHAEIWAQPSDKNTLYLVDKTWQRQFYPSINSIENNECFSPTYRFYMPWFFYKNIDVQISSVYDEYTPFIIKSHKIINNVPEENSLHVDTNFIDFKVKKDIVDKNNGRYGIIDIGTPMYDMSVKLTDREIVLLESQYGIR
jgi:hypothetical protein